MNLNMFIETERLIMRSFRKVDIVEVAKYLEDPIVMKYIEPPFDWTQTREFIYKYGLNPKPYIYMHWLKKALSRLLVTSFFTNLKGQIPMK